MREPPESHGPSGWQIAIILALIGAVATLGAAYLSSSDVNVFLSDDDSDGDNTTASTQVVTENQIAASDVAPTATFAPTATATNTPVPEPTSTPTATLVSTSTATPAPTPTSTPRPPTTTPMPPGTVLYEADESGGFADWELSGGWLLFQGMLVNDGGGGVLTVPFQPGTADYAVELEIQLVDRGGYNPFFRISMRGGAARADIGVNYPNFNNQYVNVDAEEVGKSSASLSDEWTIYRLEVKDNVVSLSLNGLPVVVATDNRLLSGSTGPVAITVDPKIQLNIRGIRIVAV